jgi:apolipoprotein N-acyltransferase
MGFVQGSVSDDVRRAWAAGDANAARGSLEVYVARTQELLDDDTSLDLVLWPETAYPGVFRKPESDAQLRLNVAFDRFIAARGVPMAFGAYDREDRTDRRVLRNALYLVTPEAEQPVRALSPMQVYHKSTLFPVGEYLPLVDAKLARDWLPSAAQLARGDGPRILEWTTSSAGVVRVGPSICYEDVFPGHAIELARDGAELLLNVSNDSWFGDLGAARWHLMMAGLRSVETRLPQVRAANTGYSAYIAPDGAFFEVTEYGASAFQSFDVPLASIGPTWIVRYGTWFGPFAFVSSMGWLVLMARRRFDDRG